MRTKNATLNYSTRGAGDFIDITEDVRNAVSKSGIREGFALIFAVGSTCGITTFEYEGGLKSDMRNFYEKLVPSSSGYEHDRTWGDANGFSHIRASLCGQSFSVPFSRGELFLGTWQQIVLAEFDIRKRNRKVVVYIQGE
mgnify:CR=1 FL=1